MTRTCQGHARPHHRGLALSNRFQCRISNELNDPCNIIGGFGVAFTHPWSVPKVQRWRWKMVRKRKNGWVHGRSFCEELPDDYDVSGKAWHSTAYRQSSCGAFSINRWCIIKVYIARLPHQIKVDKRWPLWQSLLLGQEAFQYLVVYYLKWYVW